MINATVLSSGNLLLTAGNETRSDIAAWLRDGARDRSTIWADLLESYSCNSSYADATDLIALWGGPAICEWMDYSESSGAIPQGRVWAFMDYCVQDELHELASKGRVIFTLADDGETQN